MAQAHIVQAKLEAVNVPSRIVSFVTTGDRILDKPLADIGGKGLFTKEIEESLLRGDIDVAIHSLKDMPTILPEGLEIGAVLEREDVEDVWLARHPSWKTPRDLPLHACIGTASLRRQVQLCEAFPKISVKTIRGNLGTRLSKMQAGEVEGLVLSRVGFQRLNLEHHIHHIFSIKEMLPAVGQGALALEYRCDRRDVLDKIQRIHHASTHLCITLERFFLKALEGSCQTPIGGYAYMDQEHIVFQGLLGTLDPNRVSRIKDSYHPLSSDMTLEAFAYQQAERLLKQHQSKA